MIAKRIILSAAVAGLSLAGCDRPKQASTQPGPTPSPAGSSPVDAIAVSTNPVDLQAIAPTTQPVRVTLSLRIFDRGTAGDRGTLYPFPLARVHINANDNTAVLYTDDPKTAINPGYAGNSFYLVIPLDKDHPLQLDNYQWDFRANSTGEDRKSADGIFLEGQRYQLQPADMHVAFQGEGPAVRFSMWGQFVKYDSKSRESRLGHDVVVQSGIQSARVDAEK